MMAESPSSRQVQQQVEQQEQTRHTWVAMFVWAALLVVFLYFFSPLVLVGLLLLTAGAIAAMLVPVRNAMTRLPRWLAGMVVGGGFWLAVLVALLTMGWVLSAPVQEVIQSWPRIYEGLNEALNQISSGLGLTRSLTVNDIAAGAVQWLGGGQTSEMLANVANQIGVGTVAVLLIVFGSVFLLVEPTERLVTGIKRLLPSHDRPSFDVALNSLIHQLRWWLLGITISVVVVGLTSWLGFWLVGLNFALPMAIMVGIAALVPTLGPAAAFLIVLLYASTQGLTVMLGVAGVYLGVQLLESYGLHPWIMQEAVSIPPIVTLFTIVLWGRLFGPLGIVLAIPIDLLIWTAIRHFVFYPEEQREGRDKETGKQGDKEG